MITESVKDIEKQNGFCLCPELEDLFEMRADASALETKCNSIRKGIDEFPNNLKLVDVYRRATGEFKEAVDKYNRGLALAFNSEKISMIQNPCQMRNTVYTLNCSNCHQQIDIVGQ